MERKDIPLQDTIPDKLVTRPLSNAGPASSQRARKSASAGRLAKGLHHLVINKLSEYSQSLS